LFHELLVGTTDEAKFVKAIDKMQAFAFVHVRKRGNLSDGHLRFTLKYSSRTLDYFSGLVWHYDCLREEFLDGVAAYRQITRRMLNDTLFSQLEFEF
jgi:hypothetical protein